jgi:hypothetical protein
VVLPSSCQTLDHLLDFQSGHLALRTSAGSRRAGAGCQACRCCGSGVQNIASKRVDVRMCADERATRTSYSTPPPPHAPVRPYPQTSSAKQIVEVKTHVHAQPDGCGAFLRQAQSAQRLPQLPPALGRHCHSPTATSVRRPRPASARQS